MHIKCTNALKLFSTVPGKQKQSVKVSCQDYQHCHPIILFYPCVPSQRSVFPLHLLLLGLLSSELLFIFCKAWRECQFLQEGFSYLQPRHNDLFLLGLLPYLVLDAAVTLAALPSWCFPESMPSPCPDCDHYEDLFSHVHGQIPSTQRSTCQAMGTPGRITQLNF